MGPIVLALSIWLSVKASADQSCKERDFRNKLGPPRIQDGTSWCYAHSAADLISQAIGQRISSIDLATTYLMGNEKKLRKIKHPFMQQYLHEHPNFEQHLKESRTEEDAYKPEHILRPEGILDTGGRDDEAIVLSNVKGLCLASNLPAGPENVSRYLDAIHEDLQDQKRDHSEGPIGAIENEVAQIMAHTFQRWVDMKCGKRIYPKTPLLPREISVADSLEEFKKQLAAGQINHDNARSHLKEELDRVLDSGKVAAIAYESYDLYPKNNQKGTSPHGDHSSVVAARKMIGGRCHYFVRNHFGATCGYLDEFNQLCEKENGGVWVPIEALKHLYSVISVR